jgi:hypothetical protein
MAEEEEREKEEQRVKRAIERKQLREEGKKDD